MYQCVIGDIDWANASRMKYWSFAKNYKGDKVAETRNMVFSGDYLGSLKRDGYWAGIYKNMDGEVAVLSRSKGVSGEYANHYDKLPHLHSFFDTLPKGSVLVGELYFPSNEGSRVVTTVLGCLTEKAIARQKDNPLHLYLFDVWAWNGQSYVEAKAADRFNFLQEKGATADHQDSNVEYAVYYTGKELWTMLQSYLADGREGIVITHKDCPVYFKRTPSRKSLKIKKELSDTIDCFFTGRATAPTKEYTGKSIETWVYWYNTQFNKKMPLLDDTQESYYQRYCKGESIIPVTQSFYNDWAGSLEIGVLKDGQIVPIGYLSGLTQEIKSNYKAYRGKAIEVQAMEIGYDENGKFSGLRHAKFLHFRPDITYEDCTWEKFLSEHQ